MRYFAFVTGAICLFLLTSTAAFSQPTEESAAPGGPLVLKVTFPAGHAPRVKDGTWTDRVIGIPGESAEKAAPRLELPSFSSSIVARGKRYKFTMVGSNPFLPKAKKVTIPVELIPVRFEFPDGTVLDPRAPGSCVGTISTPVELTLQSPLFEDADYGEGGHQFAEEMRRLEFWSYTGPRRLNPGYSVRLSVDSSNVFIRATLPPGYQTQAAPCGRKGSIDLESWNEALQQIAPLLSRAGITPKTFPIFLFLNMTIDAGDAGLLAGYHSWINAGGVQTFAVAMYDTTRSLPSSQDVSVLSQVIAEWYDNPLANNPTPLWGHLGQVDGCRANLEVGDPLAGSPLFEVEMPNHFTYHLQETAFFSWFYNQVPSLGINGWYSSNGSFTKPADLCR
jgi:hypothetical protein